MNHKEEAYSGVDTNTNLIESFFARIKRGRMGNYHKIAGPYLQEYVREFAWREDYRKVPNGTQLMLILHACLTFPRSARWTGYTRPKKA